jgi:GntR family transcriptional regulator, rspAB operon transcriptional repressor
MNQIMATALENQEFLVDTAYNRIRESILQLEYQPGTFLSEPMISRLYGISRTPIREAFKRLEEQNLIRIIPRKGALVTDISAEDIVEIYQLREALECYAVQFVPQNGNPQELETISEGVQQSRQWIQAGEITRIDDLDIQLHYFIARSSCNQQLVKMVDMLLGQIVRLRRMTPTIPGRLEEQGQEHTRIVHAMMAGNVEEARENLRSHLRRVCEVAVQIRIKMWRGSGTGV